jgi:hypothetical protein
VETGYTGSGGEGAAADYRPPAGKFQAADRGTFSGLHDGTIREPPWTPAGQKYVLFIEKKKEFNHNEPLFADTEIAEKKGKYGCFSHFFPAPLCVLRVLCGSIFFNIMVFLRNSRGKKEPCVQ